MFFIVFIINNQRKFVQLSLFSVFNSSISKFFIYLKWYCHFRFIIQIMVRFPTYILLSLLLATLSNSQATQTSIIYLEGCATYAQDGCCQSCEYAYTLRDGKCLRSQNTTADCCTSYNSDGSCAQCAPGLFSAEPYCNRNQIYGCIRKSGNTCLACGAGLFLQSGVCFTIIASCQNYSTLGECVSCNSGFTLVSSYCVAFPQVANCTQGNIYGCLQCASAFYLTRDRLCLPFQPGCLQYFQEKCTACLPAFTLVDGVCRIEGCAAFGANGCTQCQNGLTLDNGRCFINNCARVVEGSCVQCHRDFRLSANGCVQAVNYSCKACQSGFIFVNDRCIQIISGCLTYNSNNLCSSCLSNFQLTLNGLCQIIGCANYSSTGCAVCCSPFQLANGSCLIPNCEALAVNGCTKCSTGFLLFNGQCFPIDPNCQTYNNSTCSQCRDKFRLFNGQCLQNERGCIYNLAGQCSCVGNFVFSSSGKCIILGCSSYDNDDNCLACQAPFAFNTSTRVCFIPFCQIHSQQACRTCLSGYRIVNGACQLTDLYCASYNTNGICATCQNGFSLSSSGRCFKNVPNCTSFANDQVTCQRCRTGCLLSNGQCLLPIPNCRTLSRTPSICTACNAGFRLRNGACSPADANCVTYSLQNTTQNCTACVSGCQLLAGTCVRVQPGCIYTGTVCSNCSSPFIFDASANSCFINGCTNHSLTACLACKSPFRLFNNTCVIDNCGSYNRDCCVECLNGSRLSNGVCVNIDTNCINLVNGQCTSCKAAFSVLNGRCVVRDANCQTYNSDGICSKCVSSHFLNSDRRCQVRDPGCIYEGGRCKFCNPPFILNARANTCVIKNCLLTRQTGCVQCQAPFILSDSGCTLANCNNVQDNACVQCKAGYHLKRGVQCEIDSPDCLSYDEDGNCELCKQGLTLTSNAVCSALNSTCLSTVKDDPFKCLSCADGYFLNKFFQCEKEDAKCIEYINGVCSKCTEKFFLFSEICFPYTPGCVQYSGKDCTVCRSGFTLKNGECFKWNPLGIGILGQDDHYNFLIAPIDVRQSKYYINNLSPGSEIGKFFFSSFFHQSYQDCSLTTLNGAVGKGWKAAVADSSQFIGLVVTGEPATFYALQLESVQGSYITEFYLEYSTDGTNFIRVQNFFTVPSSVSANMTTIYFTGIYAKAIRIRISKFQGWPAARIEFFYYDSLRFKKISNLKSLKYLQETINSNFVDRVNNQIYINQAYFFNPKAACTSKDLCFTGLQLCAKRSIKSLTLNFAADSRVTSFHLTYSVDGRSYNCFNSCNLIQVPANATNSFDYQFNDFEAQGIRIYPQGYTGRGNFSPTFFYE